MIYILDLYQILLYLSLINSIILNLLVGSSMIISDMAQLIKKLDDKNSDNIDDYYSLINSVCFERDALGKYCSWDCKPYTRNIVSRNDNYELVLICWDSYQQTTIHDHNGSKGIVKSIYGKLTENRYELKNFCLKYIGETSLGLGKSVPIDDDLGLHQMINRNKKKAISLHLYLKPVNFYHVYDYESADMMKIYHLKSITRVC